MMAHMSQNRLIRLLVVEAGIAMYFSNNILIFARKFNNVFFCSENAAGYKRQTIYIRIHITLVYMDHMYQAKTIEFI